MKRPHFFYCPSSSSLWLTQSPTISHPDSSSSPLTSSLTFLVEFCLPLCSASDPKDNYVHTLHFARTSHVPVTYSFRANHNTVCKVLHVCALANSPGILLPIILPSIHNTHLLIIVSDMLSLLMLILSFKIQACPPPPPFIHHFFGVRALSPPGHSVGLSGPG